MSTLEVSPITADNCAMGESNLGHPHHHHQRSRSCDTKPHAAHTSKCFYGSSDAELLLLSIHVVAHKCLITMQSIELKPSLSSSALGWLAIAWLVLAIQQWSASAVSNGPLESKSFKLQTIIRHYAGERTLDIQVSERYSHSQLRALISYQMEGLDKWQQASSERQKQQQLKAATYLVEARESASEPVSIQVRGRGNGLMSCTQVSASHLMEQLELDSLMEASSEDQQLDRGGKFLHLVGPARWLLYIARRRAQMHAILEQTPQLIRNIPSIRYSMSVRDKSGQDVEVSVFYSEISLAQQNRDLALPNRVVFRGAKRTTFIDVATFELVPGDSLSTSSLLAAPPPSTNLNVLLDVFTLAPGTGCSLVLFRDQKPLFKDQDDLAQFSFTAKVSHTHAQSLADTRTIHSNVAYDGQLQAMRVDLDPLDRNNPFKRVRQVFSFQRNRMYHVFDKRSTGSLFEVSKSNDESENHLKSSSKQLGRESERCVTARICWVEWHRFTMGQLLLGSDNFVYLGLALVRGLRARVYEALDTELPYWLEQPIYYHHSWGVYKKRKAADSAENPSGGFSRLVTLVYLADDDVNDSGADKHRFDEEYRARILQIEVYRMDSVYGLVYDKRTIAIHDFAWTLNSIRFEDNAQAGDRSVAPHELFSLADQCSARVEEARHSQVRLLLQTRAKKELTEPLVAQRNERNLLILAALQTDLDLAISMVYDLNTRVVQMNDLEPIQLLVSFHMARHSNVTSSLTFVGLGRLPQTRSGRARKSSIVSLNVLSFQQCYLLASHHSGIGTYFGFEPNGSNACHICTESSEYDMPADGETPGPRLRTPFTISGDGNLEVYLARPRHDDHANLNAWTRETDQQVTLRDKVLMLRRNNKELALFDIKRLHVEAHESHALSERWNTGQELNGNKIVSQLEGFGFVNEAPNESQLLHITGWMQHEFAMTMSRCQAACMANLECLSFSYCVRGAKIECLLTKYNFSLPALSKRILDLRLDTSSSKLLLQLDKNGNEVSLIKYSGCSIHNKHYLSYFEVTKPPMTMKNLQICLVKAVAEVEHCARWCYMHNVEVYKEHEHKFGFNDGQLSNLTSCISFDYIDQLNLQLQTDETITLWNEITRSNKLPDIGGFCSIQTRGGVENPDALSFKFDHQITVERYHLRMEEFYDETHDVNLKNSILSSEEQHAYEDVSSSPEPSKVSVKIAQNLLARGDNFQVIMFGDKSSCASWCFGQVSQLWPSCRSFDVFVDKHRFSGVSHYRCVLNSISMQQARANNRSDLIDSTPGGQERWHYELKLGLTNEFGEIEEENRFSQLISSLFDKSPRRHRVGPMWFAVLGFFGIGSGLFLGTTLAENIRASRRQQVSSRRTRLDSLTPVVNLGLQEGDDQDNL